MVRISEVAAAMEQIAPTATAAAWDNVGLLVGRESAEVQTILVALDATDRVIDEAVRLGANMLVTHHPLIFKGVTHVTDSDSLGRRLLRLAETGIAVYAAHTNLDVADGGTNDALCALLGLENVQPLIYDDDCALAIGRHGYLPEAMTFSSLSAHVCNCLGLDGLHCCGDKPTQVIHIAVCAGSGGKYAYAKQVISAGCDVYITSDIGFHTAQDALADGLYLIDATHYATEAPVLRVLRDKLAAALDGRAAVYVAETDGQVFHTLQGIAQ